MKTSDLRKLAKKKKIEGHEDLDREELLKALKNEDMPKKSDEKEDVEETEEEEEEVIEGIKDKPVSIGSKAEVMKKVLSKQPKIRILIPLIEPEKMGSTLPITINGYRLNVMKGLYVNVPEQIADIIMDSQKQTISAVNNPMNLNNPDHPKRKSGEGLRDLD